MGRKALIAGVCASSCCVFHLKKKKKSPFAEFTKSISDRREARGKMCLLRLPEPMSFLCNGLIRFVLSKRIAFMRCRNSFSAAIRQGSGAWPPFLDNNSWICLFFTLVALSRHRLVFPFHPLLFLSFLSLSMSAVSHRDLCSRLWWPWRLCVGHLPL